MAGLGIVWSNDFGFACIGSSFLVLLILAIADAAQSGDFRKNAWPAFRRFVGYFPCLAAGVLLGVLLATRGHIGSYLSFTKDVAAWQPWYYGINGEDHANSLLHFAAHAKSMRRTWIHFGIYLVTMAYCLYRLCKKTENNRTILFVFLFTTIVAAHAIYLIGGGNDGFTEGTYTFVILMGMALLVKGGLYVARRLNWQRAVDVAAAVLLLALALYTGVLAVRDVQGYRRQNFAAQENYVPELGGVTEYAAGLREMQEIVGDNKIFSTYSTALDDMLEIDQPTGCDYIIHALGEKRFAAYVQKFKEEKYPFAQTTNFVAWPWEKWVQFASWDFYRELYSNYRLERPHSYWMLWEYAGEDAYVASAPAELVTIKNEDGSYTLRVTSEEKRPCMADVTLSWDTSYVMNGARLVTWRKMVFAAFGEQCAAHTMGEGYFRAEKGTEQHIAVHIENGVGELTLRAIPAECTALEIQLAQLNEIILLQY